MSSGDDVADGWHPEALAAFGAVAAVSSRGRAPAEIAQVVAARMRRLLAAQRCSVYLRDPQSEVFRGQAFVHAGRHDETVKRLVCGVDGDGFTQEVVRERRPVQILDAQRDPRPLRAAMRTWQVRSILGLPLLDDEDVLGVAFIDDGGRAREYTEAEQQRAVQFGRLAARAIAQAGQVRDLRAQLAARTRELDASRRVAAVEDRLATAAAELEDPLALAAPLSQLLSKPCAVLDAELRPLAVAAPEGAEPFAAGAFARSCAEHQEVKGALAEAGEGRAALVEPVPAAGLPHRHLLAPAVARGETVGYIVVKEWGRRLAAVDLAAARRAAGLAGVELSARRRDAEAQRIGRARLVADLTREGERALALAERARLHGFDMTACWCVALVASAGSSAAPPPPERIRAAFGAALAGRPLFVDHQPSASVVLLEATDAAAVARHAHAALTGRPALVAVSTPCESLAELPDAAAQARDLLATMRRTGRASVRAAEELGAATLLLASACGSQAARYARRALGPLLEPGRGSEEVLLTVSTFFEEGRSVRRAAERLDVHENTIRYRIARASELCGLDLIGNADDQLTGQVALMLLRLQGAVGADA